MLPDQLYKLRTRAMLSLALEPLPDGNNDGLVYFQDSDDIAFDSNGHEAFAHFISRARDDVMQLVAEVLYLRGELQTIASDKHLADCAKSELPTIACHCHQIIALEALMPGVKD